MVGVFTDYYKTLLSNIENKEELAVNRINLFGGRMSSKTWSTIEFFTISSLIAKIHIDLFRYMNDDKQKLWEQCLEIIDTYPGLKDTLKLNITQKKIIFPNGSEWQIHGLHKQKNDDVKMTGLAGRIGFDYGFAFAEERYEISDKEWSAVLQAIRGYNKFLEIHAANPWIFSADYVDYCHKAFPFSLETLQKEGQQFAVLDRTMKDEAFSVEMKIKEVFHYTNYSVNEYLTDMDKMKLIQAAKHDPHRANTILYGYPGIPEGSIYKHVLDKLFREYEYPPEEYITYAGCVDYGEKGDASAAYMVEFGEQFRHAHITNEYYWANKKGTKEFKDTITLATEINEHFMDIYERYDMAGEFFVEVDSAAVPFITALNNLAYENDMDGLITYVQSIKYKIAERVEQVRTMSSFGMITIGKNCKQARREYQEAVYSLKASEYRDGDDHAQDAIEYGLAKHWFKLMDALDYNKNVELQLLNKKGGRDGYK